MKFSERSGLCFVCGKPTKYLDHRPCLAKLHANDDKKRVHRKLVETEKRSRDKAAKIHYAKGDLPPWMFS